MSTAPLIQSPQADRSTSGHPNAGHPTADHPTADQPTADHPTSGDPTSADAMSTGQESTASLDPGDPRAVFARSVALAGVTIGAVAADRLDDPTACDQFDVRSLLGHMVGVLRRVAAMGRGEDPVAVSAMVDGVPDYGWPAIWVESAHEVQAAWVDDDTLSRVVRLPWATFPGSGALALYTSEITLHTWDLATATCQQPDWDDEVLTVAFEALCRALPTDGRMAEFERVIRSMPASARSRAGGPPFAEAVPVPDDAPAIDRLVAWSGRQP